MARCATLWHFAAALILFLCWFWDISEDSATARGRTGYPRVRDGRQDGIRRLRALVNGFWKMGSSVGAASRFGWRWLLVSSCCFAGAHMGKANSGGGLTAWVTWGGQPCSCGPCQCRGVVCSNCLSLSSTRRHSCTADLITARTCRLGAVDCKGRQPQHVERPSFRR